MRLNRSDRTLPWSMKMISFRVHSSLAAESRMLIMKVSNSNSNERSEWVCKEHAIRHRRTCSLRFTRFYVCHSSVESPHLLVMTELPTRDDCTTLLSFELSKNYVQVSKKINLKINWFSLSLAVSHSMSKLIETPFHRDWNWKSSFASTSSGVIVSSRGAFMGSLKFSCGHQQKPSASRWWWWVSTTDVQPFSISFDFYTPYTQHQGSTEWLK